MLATAATKQSLKTALKTLRISVDPTAQVNPRFLDQLIRSRFLRRSRKWLPLSGKQTCDDPQVQYATPVPNLDRVPFLGAVQIQAE
jgi:hypothetical protein